MEYARKHGVLSIKLSTLGPRGSVGWPDRLFLGKDLQVAWVEFKTATGKLTPLQQHRHAQLGALGWTTEIVRTVEQGRAVIDDMIEHPKKDNRQLQMW